MQPKTTTVVAAIASHFIALCNLQKSNTFNPTWEEIHADAIHQLVHNHLPSGSGINNGVTFVDGASKPDCLVFRFSYHHMNETGYTGWTDHTLRVRPAFDGVDLTITGRNTNDILPYLIDTMRASLLAKVVNISDGKDSAFNYRSVTWTPKTSS